MLDIASILAKYGLTALGIEDLAGQAQALLTAYSIEPNYVRFTARLHQLIPDLPREGLTTVYQAAKYFAQQGEALSGAGAYLVLPPAYAKVITTPTKLLDALHPLGYEVKATFVDPRTDTTVTKGVIVNSRGALNIADILDMAREQVREIVGQSPPFPGASEDPMDDMTDLELTSFVRYAPGV